MSPLLVRNAESVEQRSKQSVGNLDSPNERERQRLNAFGVKLPGRAIFGRALLAHGCLTIELHAFVRNRHRRGSQYARDLRAVIANFPLSKCPVGHRRG